MKEKGLIIGVWLALILSFAACVVVAVTIPAGIGYCQSVVTAFNEARKTQEAGNAIELRKVKAQEDSNKIEAEKVKVLKDVALGLKGLKR